MKRAMISSKVFLFFILYLVSSLVSYVVSTSYPYVTCGSVLKLVNNNYKVRLHSHDIKYGSGSGQQSVTGSEEKEDANSYWSVKGEMDKPCKRGQPVVCGTNLRLEHLNTEKNLHSHLFSSPLTNNQEISAFGRKGGEGDTGDHWTLVCSTDYWERDNIVRLKHVDTEMWLTASGKSYGRPINGQLEVIGINYPDSSSYWKTAEGVYIHPSEGSSATDIHDEL